MIWPGTGGRRLYSSGCALSRGGRREGRMRERGGDAGGSVDLAPAACGASTEGCRAGAELAVENWRMARG